MGQRTVTAIAGKALFRKSKQGLPMLVVRWRLPEGETATQFIAWVVAPEHDWPEPWGEESEAALAELVTATALRRIRSADELAAAIVGRSLRVTISEKDKEGPLEVARIEALEQEGTDE
ncbi:hypothetical protein NOR53_965 [gamma proteobacterium NOR5-3]|nr:hypothetical protein NOR53_965 [gamma proteobacterium NOR5-3]